MTTDITKTVPKFLLSDTTGYALAKAIESGLNSMLSKTESGINCILDASTMPEWRLDEMAWETNCLYDYNATVAQKRNWIADNIALSKIYGTPKAITYYLGGYFDDVELEEAADYGGSAFHFRVNVTGNWTASTAAWAVNAIEKAKNVRSVFDGFRVLSDAELNIEDGGSKVGTTHYLMCSTTTYYGDIIRK